MEEIEKTEEQLRVEALQARFDALKCPFDSMKYHNEFRANLKYFRNVELPQLENADELLTKLEEIDAIYYKNKLEKEAIDARRKNGEKIRKIAEKLIDTVIGINIEFGVQLSDSYPDIASLVMNYHPFRAKALIEQIEPDGILTQAMKNELLEVFNE